MSQAERLKKVINSLLESPNSFAKGIGLSTPTTVYDVIKGEREITPALLKRIIATYPNINSQWLLEGIGTMLISGDSGQKINEPTENYGKVCQSCRDKDFIIDKLNKIIEQQQRLIDQINSVNKG